MARTWLWTYDNAPSDLTGGTNFTNRMLAYAEDQGTISVDVPFNATETDYMFTLLNQPGSSTWPHNDPDRPGFNLTWRARVRITTANTKITLGVSLQRVNYAGVFQQAYAGQVSISCSTTGLKTFAGPVSAQTNPQPGDRIRMMMQWTRNNNFGGTGVVAFHYGNPAEDTLEVPIVMPNARIIWDGNSLDFPGPLTGYGVRRVTDGTTVRSDGVVHATLVHSAFRRVRIALDSFDDIAFWRRLSAWWSWADAGNPYAFALDPADMVDKALSGAAARGQKDIPIANTADIVSGRAYRLVTADGRSNEIIVVGSVVTNAKVVAVNNLELTYAAGDIFRSIDYHPRLVRVGTEEPFTENPGLTYTLDTTGEEDRV